QKIEAPKPEPVVVKQPVAVKPEPAVIKPKPTVRKAIKIEPIIKPKPVKKLKPIKKKIVKKIEIKKEIVLPKFSLPPLSRKMVKPIKTKTKISVLTVVYIAVAVVVLITAIDVLGMYRFGWQDNFSRQVSNILPFPAGTVNNKMIRLSDYLSDVKTIQLALQNDREGVDGLVTGANVNERIFNRLALNTLLAQELKNRNQSVTSKELEQVWVSLVNVSGEKQIKESIRNMYGLSESQFKEKVLKPLLMKDKLQALITQDESLKINQDAKKKAEEVLALALQPNVDFAVLAGQYTQDEAGVNTGGDLGWISKGEVPAELEKALFSLAPGTVSKETVKNKIGYHIIKAETKLTDKDTGEESVKARQILIKVDINQYLKEWLSQARLRKFVK
ncbi:MAG: peptidylprolyl isomerase, partial [Patescibacteria group bacterium]